MNAMQRMRHGYLIIGLTIGMVLSPRPAEAQFTDNYQTNTISGITTNWAGDYIVGSNTFADALLIQNSGVLFDDYGYLGYEIGSSNNSVLVTGTGSIWNNLFKLYVGFSGAGNSMVISNGGLVCNTYNNWDFESGYVGYNSSSSNNSVFVIGSGSVWSNNNGLTVGYAGAGNSLVISNGGQVFDYYGMLGNDVRSSNNSVFVIGSGSVWSNYDDLTVGYAGAGNSLVISNGGQVINNYFCDVGSHGNTVLVTDPGSVWNNYSSLRIGNSGVSNRMVISDGGQVFSKDGYVGYNNSSNNSILITGSGSIWINSNRLVIGSEVMTAPHRSVGNSLVISNGGKMFSTFGGVGTTSGGSNSVLVTGSGSVWSNSTRLYIGYGSDFNSLVISNGGQVVNSECYVGAYHYYTSSSSNSVRVTDNAIWQNDILYVGYQGSGNSLVVVGGSVFATNLVVGFDSATCDNIVQLDSGSVIVTNATADAVLEVRSGQFILNGGVLRADILVITNACARFIRNGGTLLVGSLVLDPTMDADGDGLSNGWEQAHGFDPLNAADAALDSDGDGFKDWQEILAGTNPTNSASYLHISSLVPTGADVLVNWTTVGGKSYAVQTNSAPDSNFGDVSPVIAVPGDGESVTNYLDVGAATNGSTRYYRIRLVP